MELDRKTRDSRHDSKYDDQEETSKSPLPSSSSPSGTNSSPIELESDKQRTMEHDSLVSVRLSGSSRSSLQIDTNVFPPQNKVGGLEDSPSASPTDDAETETIKEEKNDEDRHDEVKTLASTYSPSLREELESVQEGDEEAEDDNDDARSKGSSAESEDVNWDDLQKKEDEQVKEQDVDNTQSTAMLLAKLEQENNKIATNPKSVKVAAVEKVASPGRKPRPPSMAQLRQMVNGPTPPALRYSVLPPPPMTELEFYMALVKDPKQTAARLPTLLSNKIRKGIPPPLRGVVWQSMCGARDKDLEDVFERLSGESSPYEGIIGKDLGRSFPGVEMFRDPEGDGQRMLGRVLKTFSLYDTKIGYCQGLAFLVGPLLMHMPDKHAFCVLVRLMENYDLRHCFVPDLSGLHVRIYQFTELLKQHLPVVADHLEDLGVEPAYVSQWFLSFFAVTCPLPMLFRIYDVIFAEGASETIMRVALSLMRKNEGRILACTEMEDVMQLLLSRGLWDCYHYNADEFVQDFVALSDVVTRERMALLEQGYREAKIPPSANPKSEDAPGSDVATAASRFLGRLWASSSTPKLASFASAVQGSSTASSSSPTTISSGSTLSPGLSRPLSMLRRSTSKQSIASTFNSMEAASQSSSASSSASVLSSASTEATSVQSRDSSTTVDHDSSRDSVALGSSATSTKAKQAHFSVTPSLYQDDRKHLHTQIEDLLTALSELQRNHALLASQLQKEREEREEDRQAVRSLLDGLRKKANPAQSYAAAAREAEEEDDEAPHKDVEIDLSPEELSDLLDFVADRFSEEDPNKATIPQTKEQLHEDLVRVREQLSNEQAKTQECNRRIHDMEQEMATMKEQLRETHAHVRNMHAEKQRLERQIHGMRVRASDSTPSSEGGDWFGRSSVSGSSVSGSGLRELKLVRSKSSPAPPPVYPTKRSSSMMTTSTLASTHRRNTSNSTAISAMTSNSPPAPAPVSLAAASPANTGQAPTNENDALLLELVQAKTAEAMAKQEAEEAKQQLERMRKAFGLAPGEMPSMNSQSAHNSMAGMFGRLTGPSTPDGGPGLQKVVTSPPATSAGNTASGASFWGWGRK
ncbi:rab-GTPase-TBC domain-containing protein [Neurospora intermedia]|uniref:Rab-GTPase-TBC domain-containing protein n=1 Tax=Neurospora intermedia TaxID=5142 RepID=A0ABR3DKB1_NEUIN